MAATEKQILEKATRGRPKTYGTPVLVRIQPDLLARVDAYRATLPGSPSRPEAIRSMIEALLNIVEKGKAE